MNAFCLVINDTLFTFPMNIVDNVCVGRCTPGKGLMHFVQMVAGGLDNVPSVIFNLFNVTLFIGCVNFNSDVLTNSLALNLLYMPLIVHAARRTLGTVPSDVHRNDQTLKTAGLRAV